MSDIVKCSLLILAATSLLVVAGWSSFQVFELSSQRAAIKKDYSVVNSITFGLLSVNTWRDHVTKIIINRIDDFEFTPAQEDTLVFQVEQILHAGIDKGESLLEEKKTTIGGKLKKFAIKTFVNEDKVRDLVPVFSQTIVDEIQKPENKKALKFVAKSKLMEYSDITYADSTDALVVDSLLDKYEAAGLAGFNHTAKEMLQRLQEETYLHTFIALGVVLLFLILWLLLRNVKAVHTPFFVISVLLSLVILAAGITAPMIEIDARFQEVSLLLIGEQITFNDQVIFFQSKSIVDVVAILLDTGKLDSILVGILILLFSILFPVAKLLATQVYLLGSERLRRNQVIRFFAFRSGKWSMADVYVIAIFMAFIGFQGILNNQLAVLNVETDSLISVSTNHTSLQPGFLLFIGFVLFSLLLSLILKKITKKEQAVVI